MDFSHTADYRVSPALPNWDKTDRNLNKQLPRDTLSAILSTSKCQLNASVVASNPS